MLYQRTCPSAFHNVVDPLRDSKLLPTPSPIIEAITNWLSSSDPQNVVMWLDGGTDSEKSAICHTVAQTCIDQHLLSGSFSFRPTTTNAAAKHDASELIVSLIYQLLLHIPETRNYIAEKIAADFSILDRSWEMQLDTLLIQPLVAVAQSGLLQDAQRGPRLFIIDGLDECDKKTQCLVVEAFTAALEKVPESIPHKLLFSSQSEPHLVSTCRQPPISTRLRRLYLEDNIQLSLVESVMELKGKLHALQSELSRNWEVAEELGKDRLELRKREEELQKKRQEMDKRERVILRKEQEIDRREQEIRWNEEEIQRMKGTHILLIRRLVVSWYTCLMAIMLVFHRIRLYLRRTPTRTDLVEVLPVV